MPICEPDPWRVQFFEGVPCPDEVCIPTKDTDAWRWYPKHRWVYNKLTIAETQGLDCGPHGLEPPAFPVFSKPVYNLRSMSIGSRPIHSLDEYNASQMPGHFWAPLLVGEHISTDVAIVDGQARWWRHAYGAPLPGGMFDYWVVLAEAKPKIEAYCGAWIAKNLAGYNGIANFETIDTRIIEAHLRFADQWPDLYGGDPWVAALIGLYRDGAWHFDDSNRRTGYSVVLFGSHGVQHCYPPDDLVADIRARPGISSVQISFHPDWPAALHANPPGGFRMAIINCDDLKAGVKARAALAQSFSVTQDLQLNCN